MPLHHLGYGFLEMVQKPETSLKKSSSLPCIAFFGKAIDVAIIAMLEYVVDSHMISKGLPPLKH